MNRAMGIAAAAALVLIASPSRVQDVSEHSIYRLEGSWIEDNGQALTLSDLRGNVQVVAFFYTTCAGICPVTVKALQMLAAGEKADGAQAQFLLVTMDPKRDDLAALRRYRRTMRLEKGRWRLVRGSEMDVRKLAALLGFNYEQIESGEFVHANLVTVLDAQGRIVHQQSGVAEDPASLREAIQRAGSGDRGKGSGA